MMIVVNFMVSALIVGRLLWYRSTVTETLGKKHAKFYTGLAAVFVEGAVLYTITGLIHLICFARKTYAHVLVIGVLTQVEVRY